MANSVDDFNKKRLKSSNITVVISIALVLFLVGLFGLIMINARKYSDFIKEQLVMVVFFDEHLDVEDKSKIDLLNQECMKEIQKLAFVKKVVFISQEMASKQAKIDLGIDSNALFEENIFPSSLEVSLKANYVDPVKLGAVVKELSLVKGVKEVKNDSKLTFQVYNNLNRILTWILGFSILFLIVAIVLINNSIRLKIFSKRFIIKTMQLVGAKRWFIIWPFVKEAIIIGFLGAFIGLVVLFGAWYYFTSQIDYAFVQEPKQLIYLIIGVIGIGIFITSFSSILATWRFLKTKINDLYYN